MSYRHPFAIDEIYHIYNRGVDKRRIFSRTEDYHRLLSLLYLANSSEAAHMNNFRKRGGTLLDTALSTPREDTLVDLFAYCLMPNHFHLIIREKSEGGISRFMQKITTGYTMYFNTRYERSGALFQGVFKSSHVDSDRYLRYLVAYVHLNPVKLIEPQWKETGIADRRAASEYLTSYQYSSHPDYSGEKRKEHVLVNAPALLEHFDSPLDFNTNVTEWLSYQEA